MKNTRESWWHRYVPTYASSPLKLAVTLFKSGRRPARSAMYLAAAGIALTPVDLILTPLERREYERASEPQQPIILVVGPPRSGTTLVAQYLINTFNVCYLNNLTSLFPRSPIIINKLLGKLVAALREGEYDAFYGKSSGVLGVNDALYIWDRWLGREREQVPDSLEPGAEGGMKRFFGALQSLYRLPVVNKVNRLNTCAHLVSRVLPNARFLCLQRDPVMLAQSLYIARRDIVGDMSVAYGVQHPDAVEDPVEDVCRQVLFHEEQARGQQRLLGDETFTVFSYEGFCKNPLGLICFLDREYPELTRRDDERSEPRSFDVSNERKLPQRIFGQMQMRLSELGAGNVNCRAG